MKYLGRTPQNGVIVELTEHENNILCETQRAMEGQGWDWSRAHCAGEPKDGDMSDAFRAVKEFVVMRFALNDFKEATSRLEERLGKLEAK